MYVTFSLLLQALSSLSRAAVLGDRAPLSGCVSRAALEGCGERGLPLFPRASPAALPLEATFSGPSLLTLSAVR